MGSIEEDDRVPYIHPDDRVDCEACEPACPVGALHYEDGLPGECSEYYKVIVSFFLDLGSSEGPAKVCPAW